MTFRPVTAVAVLNLAGVDDGLLALAVEAYRAELPAFAEAWGLSPPGLNLYPPDYIGKPEEEAAIAFVNSGANPNTFGAHAALGLYRYGYCDVETCRAGGESLTRCFGHELFELVADPDVDRWTTPINGVRYSLEVCDPVQRFSRPRATIFMGITGDVDIACYVNPRYFDPTASVGPLDSQGMLTAPLQIAPGGYLMSEANGAATVRGDSDVRVTSFGRTARRLTKVHAAPPF